MAWSGPKSEFLRPTGCALDSKRLLGPLLRPFALRGRAEAPELPGCEPDPASKDATEVARVAEPDRRADALHRLSSGAEQRPRSVDTESMDMLGERLVERSSEDASQVIGAAGERPRDLGGAQVWLAQMIHDEGRRLPREGRGPVLGLGWWREQDLRKEEL